MLNALINHNEVIDLRLVSDSVDNDLKSVLHWKQSGLMCIIHKNILRTEISCWYPATVVFFLN